MMTSDDKVGGWVKKGQNHDDVILEWSLRASRFLLKPGKMSVRMEELSLTLDFCRVIWRIKLQRRTTLCNLFSFFLLSNTLLYFFYSKSSCK